jgi:hypothetical protein
MEIIGNTRGFLDQKSCRHGVVENGHLPFLDFFFDRNDFFSLIAMISLFGRAGFFALAKRARWFLFFVHREVLCSFAEDAASVHYLFFAREKTAT